MKKHRLKFILIFIFLRLISLVWNSYLMEASDGKITTNDILSSIGFGAIYLIFFNAPIYYLYIVVLEFVCKKLNNKFILQFILCTLLGVIISNLFCLLVYNRLYLEMFSEIIRNGSPFDYLFFKTNWAFDYILCYSIYGFIFPVLFKLVKNK